MEETNSNDPKTPPAKASAPESAPRKTQADLDADSKRRAAPWSTRAPTATPGAGGPTDLSAAALASREAVERNMEERDSLTKRRAAARDGPATVAGVVSSKPEPMLPPATVETVASAGAPTTAARQPGTSQAAEEDFETNQKMPARSSVEEDSKASTAVATEVVVAVSHVVSPVASLDHLHSVAGAEAVDIPPDLEKGFDESHTDKEGVEVSHEATVTPVPRSMDDEAMEEAPVYPGLDASLLDNFVADGIDAFVADTIVDATAVAVVMSEEEEEQFEQKRRKKYLCYGSIVLVVVTIAIVVPVAIMVGGNRETVVVEQPPSIAPSEQPSSMPSSSPTSNLFSKFLDYLKTLNTSPSDLGNDTSAPQYMAAKWLVDGDDYTDSLSLEDPKTLQRYALATLYFATGGNNWKLCGRNSPSCGDTIWLTATDECYWFDLACENGTITQISFGK
jgi:hypothetical protein